MLYKGNENLITFYYPHQGIFDGLLLVVCNVYQGFLSFCIADQSMFCVIQCALSFLSFNIDVVERTSRLVSVLYNMRQGFFL